MEVPLFPAKKHSDFSVPSVLEETNKPCVESGQIGKIAQTARA
jgi:hypothetical protein